MGKQEYKAVVVGLDSEEGILFAKRADNKGMAFSIIMDDILRLLDTEPSVTLKAEQDGYGEDIIGCYYGDDNHKQEIDYKICFDDEDEDTNEE